MDPTLSTVSRRPAGSLRLCPLDCEARVGGQFTDQRLDVIEKLRGNKQTICPDELLRYRPLRISDLTQFDSAKTALVRLTLSVFPGDRIFGRGFNSENEEPLQVSWNRKIRDSLDVFIHKSIGFGQLLLGVLKSTDKLRISRKRQNL